MQTKLIFDRHELAQERYSDCFIGLFFDRKSYMSLVNLVKVYFQIDITNNDQYKCLSSSYLLLSSVDNNLKLGKKAKVKVDGLLQHNHYRVIAAHIYLKNNFTSNDDPHVIVTKPDDITAYDAGRVLKESDTEHQYLPTPLIIHGMIGALINSGQEKKFTPHQQVVTRPEVTISVDCDPDPESSEKETFMGCPVLKGPRGGKYIIKDGRKKYVRDDEIKNEQRNNGCIMNINLLS
jgi:hypothetical protein